MKPLRRSALTLTAVTFIASLAGCGGVAGEARQQQEVTSITIASSNNPWMTGIEKHLAEYKDLTGVDVQFEA